MRAHLLLCMLAYYVQWHLKRAWEPLLFEEEDLETIRRQRDPVATAEPSAEVQAEEVDASDGRRACPRRALPHCFANWARVAATPARWLSDPSGNTFEQLTDLTPLQAEAFRLLDL